MNQDGVLNSEVNVGSKSDVRISLTTPYKTVLFGISFPSPNFHKVWIKKLLIQHYRIYAN